MTDLTEQWKKGELNIYTNYYIRTKNGNIEIQMYVGGFLYNEDNPIDEVLAEVPSYELWKAVHEQRNVLFVENTKLKELLKECREVIHDHIVWIGTKGGKLCDKIDQVLGEE